MRILDAELFERGIAKSWERAKEMIKSMQVSVDGKICTKPAQMVTEDSLIDFFGEKLKFVGRGGLKLEKAIDIFGISVDGKTCVDIGASTGGFTDCMLQNGAYKVFAVDVGHDQLDEKLKNDKRVINMEKTNIREVSADTFGDNVDFVSVDVSFISLKLVLPAIKSFLCEKGEICALVKPQFESERSEIGKGRCKG